MIAKKALKYIIPIAAAVLLSLYAVPRSGFSAAEGPIENFLPVSGFSKGWVLPGQIRHYNPGNLYTYINGEAELFLPYGFDVLASAFYGRGSDTSGIVADIYRMGSRIDAFGIYSYYRDPEAEKVKLGGEGFVEDSQLMFYKDRYFVRLSVSGTLAGPRDALIMFAKEIDRKLPGASLPPGEIALIGIPGVNPESIRYTARSVLGYAFFQKGLTADIEVNGNMAKAFIILNGSVDHSRTVFAGYVEYLEKSGVKIDSRPAGNSASLAVNDPLYKGTYIRVSGPYLLGVTRLHDPLKAVPVIDRIESNIKK